MTDDSITPSNERDEKGRFTSGNTYKFKSGVSGNPNGAPRKDQILKALDEDLGAAPREMLYKVLDQALNGAKHFEAETTVAKAIEKGSLKDIAAICTYLDEQANGKAKIRSEHSGAVIMLTPTAERL